MTVPLLKDLHAGGEETAVYEHRQGDLTNKFSVWTLMAFWFKKGYKTTKNHTFLGLSRKNC